MYMRIHVAAILCFVIALIFFVITVQIQITYSTYLTRSLLLKYHVKKPVEPIALVVATTPVEPPTTLAIIYNEYEENLKSKAGGSGELVFYRTIEMLLSGMDNVAICRMSNPQELDKLLMNRTTPTIIFTDPYNVPTLQKLPSQHLAKHSERYRFLDCWGTPPEQNHFQWDLKHFLNPYQNDYNQLIGVSSGMLSVEFTEWRKNFPPQTDCWNAKPIVPFQPKATSSIEIVDYTPFKKQQGVIWGKDFKNFKNHHFHLFEYLLSQNPGLTLHVTLDPEQALFLPDYLVNHGIVNVSEWMDLLRESKFVMGLGDPITGPTPLDAISVGCVYLDPVYPQPKTFWMNKRMKLASQHEWIAYAFKQTNGPFIYQYPLHEFDTVQEVLKDVLSEGRLFSGMYHPLYTYESMLYRLRYNLQL